MQYVLYQHSQDKEMKKNFTDACRKYAGDRPEICQEMQKNAKKPWRTVARTKRKEDANT